MSFQNVKSKWVPEVKHYAPDTPMIMVGLKADMRGDTDIARLLESKGLKMVRAIRLCSSARRSCCVCVASRFAERVLNCCVLCCVCVPTKQVTAAEGAQRAKELGCQQYLECSAVTQDGLKQVFDTAIQSAIKKQADGKRKTKCTIL
jgi:GTPase SAR1 family protein